MILAVGLFFVVFFSGYLVYENSSRDVKKSIRNSFFVSKAVQFRNSLIFTSFSSDKDTKNIQKLGWISDIHADRFKRRQVDSGLLYPRQYEDYLPEVFREMKKQGVKTVVATGDNTNSGDDNYSKDLKRIAREMGMEVIWVKGNHDNEEVMRDLGVGDLKYYYSEIGDYRIIVLDDTENISGDYYGGIGTQQTEWLKNALKTEKGVMIAMHVPIFSLELEDKVIDRYVELEKILKESGNVKAVLSGHFHVQWQKEFDGLNFYGMSALTREGDKGGYAIIDLKNAKVDFKKVQIEGE